MARTSNVFTRVEPEIKEQAEKVLGQLGISMSSAVEMFLRQVVLQRGIPFEMKLPAKKPLEFETLTKEQFDYEIKKGYDSIKRGDVYSAETGLALCIAKKALGNMPNFNNVFRKWIPEDLPVENIVMQVEGVDFAKAMADGDFLKRFKDGIQRAFGREEV